MVNWFLSDSESEFEDFDSEFLLPKPLDALLYVEYSSWKEALHVTNRWVESRGYTMVGYRVKYRVSGDKLMI